ncbi:MAG TPA: hypothetical protein VFC19_38770 [Candidatus Limnocylindrales bacterium]|nr:hypothetical protein [Candidatus Limnocylindrales bacterium]
MFKLRRLYVDTIGVPGNRFVDLCIEATDLSGDACDTIVWLRNGAGKTTMLSLLLALVLPARRDFLASRTKRRTLEDLVGGQDTAHVIAEWVDPRGQLFLTGAIYQWDGRVRPREYNGEGKNRLKRHWWCLHPDEAVPGATFDTLPTTSRSAGAVDLDRFVGYINSLAAQGVNASVTDKIGEWHEALRQRRFDPDLFRYFAEVNATEGGIDALFAGIDSAGAFVRYLLRFVADERRVMPVRDLLGETALEIAKRPVYQAEREFCAEARPLVEALGQASARLREAAQRRDEVRKEVAGFKRALHDARDLAVKQSEIAGGRHDQLEEQRSHVNRRAEATRRQRDEYRRLAAVFRQRAATAAVAAARQAAEVARNEADAWAAVPDLSAVSEARTALEAHRLALRTAAVDAAPALAAVEHARAQLAGSLDHHLDEVGRQLASMDETVQDAQSAKEAATTKVRQAMEEQAELKAQRKEHATTIERADTRLRRLIDDGVVHAGERLSAAAHRLAGEAAQGEGEIARLKAAIERASGERTMVRNTLPGTRKAADSAHKEHQALSAKLKSLADDANMLRAEGRLRELIQAEEFDPIGESHDLLAALENAVATGDAAALDVRVEGADDERAIAALDSTGLLPPRQAVSTVVEALTTAGIAAQTGWRYITEHRAAEATTIIAALPEIADGVVVYIEPHDAAAAIAGLVTSEPVVIAKASSLTEDTAPCVVIGPSPARYDPAAAAAELATRRERAATQRQRLQSLAAARSRDADLIARLRQLTRRVPADGMPGLAARAETAEANAKRLAHEVEELNRRDDELHADLETRRGELAAHERRQHKLHTAQSRVDSAVVEEREQVAPARGWLEALPGLLQAAGEREAHAAEHIRSQDVIIDVCRRKMVGLQAKQSDWAAEREALAVEIAVPSTQPPEASRTALRIAEDALRQQFPEAELRRKIEDAEQALAAAATRYQAHPQPARSRAEQLVTTDATAHDPMQRTEAIRRANEASQQTQLELGEAVGEEKAAKAEVKEHSPSDRQRYVQELPVEPADRDDALRLAAAAIEELATLQHRAGSLERERDEAAHQVQRWTARAGLLLDQTDKLPAIEPAEAASGNVDADDDRVRADVAGQAKRLAEAETSHASASSARSARADALRTWAHQDRFAKVADDEQGMTVRQLRDMFRSDNLVERVAPRATELAADLATREQRIAQQLAQVEVHKHNVVARLADLVGEALTDLSRASALSELPADVGPWAGQQFLQVAPRTRPTLEQIQVRIGELVDRMVAAGKIDLDPVELLWRATEAAVTDGFRASILKPAPDQPSGRSPVQDMHKWSGGENLTASLVLFCVFAKLRAENRAGAKAGAAGGVVPLDNPLGKANYLPFLELQRKVAAANGAQLLFWTGIGDLAAVGAFPRIAAMRKKPAAGRPGAAYVVPDLDASATADDTTHIVEHLSAVRAER